MDPRENVYEMGNRLRQRLRGVRRTLIALAVVLVAFLFFGGSCLTYVAPNEVAIKESRWPLPFVEQGVQKQSLPGGRLYFLLPGQRMHLFPTDVQVMELTRERSPEGGSRRTRFEPDVEINTSDGSRVRVDVTVQYRIVDSYQVMTRVGPGRQFEDTVLIPKTVSALKQHMGAMVAENFYDVHKRLVAGHEAQRLLNDEVKEKGLEIIHVLLRQYSYQEEYQKQIEEKKINDQLVFTRESETRAATEEARKKEIDAQGRATVDVELQRGQAETTKIAAGGEAYARKRNAEGDLLMQLAEARGTELLNAAYRGSGSENIVGLEMADVLKGLGVVLIPTSGKSGMNPLDLSATLRLFDVP